MKRLQSPMNKRKKTHFRKAVEVVQFHDDRSILCCSESSVFLSVIWKLFFPGVRLYNRRSTPGASGSVMSSALQLLGFFATPHYVRITHPSMFRLNHGGSWFHHLIFYASIIWIHWKTRPRVCSKTPPLELQSSLRLPFIRHPVFINYLGYMYMYVCLYIICLYISIYIYIYTYVRSAEHQPLRAPPLR